MIINKQFGECDHCGLTNSDNEHGLEYDMVRRYRAVSTWDDENSLPARDFSLMMDLCGGCRHELRSVISNFKKH